MSATVVDRLTSAEKSELARHETTIQRGLKHYYEVGEALLAIREKRLYRADYANFQAYCVGRWQMSKTHANRMIDASEVADNLTPIGVIPANEAQARELVKLAPLEQRIVYEVARQTTPDGKSPTAAHIKSVVNVFTEVVTVQALDDGTGEQIHVADVVKAAVTEETYERMQRQKTHIKEFGWERTLSGQKPKPMIAAVVLTPDGLEFDEVPDLKAGVKYRVLFYEVSE